MSMDAKGIIGGGKKENRKAGDLYPTPAEVTVALLDFLKPYLSNGGRFGSPPAATEIWQRSCATMDMRSSQRTSRAGRTT